MSSGYREVRVVEVRDLTPRIRQYLLRATDGLAMPTFGPGAHVEVMISTHEGELIVRHYSLIGGEGLTDDDPDTYRIAVQREDRKRGSAYIHEHFQPGFTLKVSRPKQNFALDHRDRRSLLIAGGIGVTPIYAMLRSLKRRGRPFELVYSGRSREQMAFADEILTLAGENGALHLSGEPARDHLDVRALLETQSVDTTVYVCGPAPMITAVHAAASDLGWAEGRVRSERFTAAPSTDDQAFEVVLRQTGRTIRIGRDTSILDALTKAGVPVLSDCRRGECGLCPLPVVETDGPIQHRDSYLSEDERNAGDNLCICVSRIAGQRLVLDA